MTSVPVAPNNRDEARADFGEPCLVALEPEAIEHNRLMLRLGSFSNRVSSHPLSIDRLNKLNRFARNCSDYFSKDSSASNGVSVVNVDRMVRIVNVDRFAGYYSDYCFKDSGADREVRIIRNNMFDTLAGFGVEGV